MKYAGEGAASLCFWLRHGSGWGPLLLRVGVNLDGVDGGKGEGGESVEFHLCLQIINYKFIEISSF